MSNWTIEPYRFDDAAPPPPPAGGEPPWPPQGPPDPPDEPPEEPFRADLPKKKPKRSGGGGGRRTRRILAGVGTALVLLVLLGAVGGWAYFLRDLPSIPSDEVLWSVNRAPGMTFLDREGKVIASRGPKHGTRVTQSELPPYVPRAFLAAEDRRFYKHGALDPQGMLRAARRNLTAGRVVQGGSTLTQQLAKTLFLTTKRTWKRKVQEAILAVELQRRLGRDEILDLYLNRIFFGSNAYGIDAASETYFGKPARDLTLGEAAMLAALPKAPTRLALTNDFDAALRRSKLILDNMLAEGWITEAQEAAALAHPPQLAPESPGEGEFGYVLDMAAAQAVKLAGESAPDLVIRLTIDPKLTAQAQEMVREVLATNGKRAGATQGAMVAMTPDGAIRALVGGVDHRASAFNRAYQAQRQPGSSFKPFVYAAALEQGVMPTDIRQDAPVKIGDWTPANYEGGYRGPVTVQDALAHSINTVAVKLASEVGPQRLGEIAHRFGLRSIPDFPNLAVALGAYEVNLLELTSGYQVFQNQGGRVEPYLIESIATSGGQSIYAHAPSAAVNVYDQVKAGYMVRMMEGVIQKGTGRGAAIGRPAAGKTGTSQNWRDAWFVGFTPDWIAGVWVGNDDDRPMNRVTGGAIPAEIWRRFMTTAHSGLPVRDFDWLPPPPATETVADSRNGFYDELSSDFAHAAEDANAALAVEEKPAGDQREEAEDRRRLEDVPF